MGPRSPREILVDENFAAPGQVTEDSRALRGARLNIRARHLSVTGVTLRVMDTLGSRSAGYGGVPPCPARPQLGLFDNPIRAFSLDELVETVNALEREGSGQTADELTRAVFAELSMKRTRRACELVAEAIRMARTREPRAEITGSRWQASTQEVRIWALSAGFELGSDGSIPERAIAAYNQTHPDRPY